MGEGVSLSHPRLGDPGANHWSLVSPVVSVPSSREHVSFCVNNLPGVLPTRLKRFSLTQIRNGKDGFLPSGLRAFSKFVRGAGAGKRVPQKVLFEFKHTAYEEVWLWTFRLMEQPVLPIACSGTVSSIGSTNLDLRSVGYGVKQSSIDVTGRPKKGSTSDLNVVAGSDDVDIAGSMKGGSVCARSGVASKNEDTGSDRRSSFPMGSAPTRSKSVRFDCGDRPISNSQDLGGYDTIEAVVADSGVSGIAINVDAIIDAAGAGVGFCQEGRCVRVGSRAIWLVWVRCIPIWVRFLPHLAHQIQWSKGIHGGFCPCSIWINPGHFGLDHIWNWLICWFGPLVDWMTSGLCLFSGIGSHLKVVTSMVLGSLINARMLCEGCRLSSSFGGPCLVGSWLNEGGTQCCDHLFCLGWDACILKPDYCCIF